MSGRIVDWFKEWSFVGALVLGVAYFAMRVENISNRLDTWAKAQEATTEANKESAKALNERLEKIESKLDREAEMLRMENTVRRMVQSSALR